MRPIWPLTGRAEELAFIAAASAPRGGSRGAVLAGSAGVGKTRLAREALGMAEQRGMTTRWVAATDSARRVPLGAFATLLGSVVDDPTRALHSATEALLDGDRGGGVVVGVDDAHLLDPVSALLVHQVVLHDLATVVVTLRTGAPAPDAVTAVWKDLGLDRLEVQPLSEDETGALLQVVLTGPIDAVSVRRIWALTHGNALFLRQLVDGEVRAGRLHADRGMWRWSGDPVISSELIEVVEARMGRLSGSAREVVDLLAIGEPLGTDVLCALTDPVAVEDAEAQGLVSVEWDGRRARVMLAHPLYGEARLARVGSLRARRLRGAIAQALGRPGPWREADTLRRAVLAVDSDLDPDPELLIAGAQSASNVVDMSLAERLARAAVDAAGNVQSQLILASALSFQNRGGEAETILADMADHASNDLDRSVVAVTRAANLLWTIRNPAAASAVLARAEEIVLDEGCRLVLRGMRTALDTAEGRAGTAVDTAAQILSVANLPTQTVMLATIGLVTGLGVLGRGAELGPVADRGYAEAGRSVECAFLRFGLAFAHLHALRLAGYLHESEAVARARGEECSGMPGPAQLYGIAIVGETALARGRIGGAVRCLREAWAALEPVDTQGYGFVCLLRLTEALALAGDFAAAGRACDQLESDKHPAFAYLEPEVLLARAWVTASEGSVRRATAIAHRAAAESVRLGQPAHEVIALQTAVRFGDRTVADRLALLARTVDGPRAPAAAAHAAALASNDGEALNRVSRQLEDMGDLLAAADAAAQAAGVLTEHGHTGTAATAAARAQRLVQACDGAHTPAVDAATRPLPLTEREREIVTLAARGLSNRAIAEQLVVSVRTVEGHLYNASGKLGVANRSELGEIFSES